MTEEEKKRIISLSSYQPDSTTDYRTAQVAVPKNFDYDEYQRRMDMVKRGQEIQNLGLYEQAGIENTGLPYYQVGKRDTQLTPEQYASFAQREGFDPEDYYSSLEWMNQNVNPLTKDLNDFNIGLAGAKEGLRTPLREQLLGPQHASTSYGSFEWSPEEVTVDRTGRRVFDQRTLQTKANERAGKPATYLETQGTLAYPAWEKAYNEGTITTPWEEGVVDQKGLVTGDSELYNAENAAEIQGTTKLDKKIEPKVKWSNKVLLDQEPYPKITIPNVPPSNNAYGGFMNRYNYGSYLDTASMEAMTGAEAAAYSMNEGGLTDKQKNAGMAGLQGLSAMGNTMGTEPKGEKEGAWDQTREAAAGTNPIIGLFHGASQAGESIVDSAMGKDDNAAKRGMKYAFDPFGAKMETSEDPNLTGQDKTKVMAMQVLTAGMGDKDMLNLEGIEKQDRTAFNYGAYGGNLYAAGGPLDSDSGKIRDFILGMKLRNVSKPYLGKEAFTALQSIGDYGYQGDPAVLTSMLRAKGDKVYKKESKHNVGKAFDVSAKEDSREFIDWVNTDQGKKWISDFGINYLDETSAAKRKKVGSKGTSPHHHFAFKKDYKKLSPNIDPEKLSQIESEFDAYKEKRKYVDMSKYPGFQTQDLPPVMIQPKQIIPPMEMYIPEPESTNIPIVGEKIIEPMSNPIKSTPLQEAYNKYLQGVNIRAYGGEIEPTDPPKDKTKDKTKDTTVNDNSELGAIEGYNKFFTTDPKTGMSKESYTVEEYGNYLNSLFHPVEGKVAPFLNPAGAFANWLVNRNSKEIEIPNANKAYGGDLGYYGDLQPMPMMSPQPLPVNTPGIQSHVNYDPEVLQGRMEKLYNPQRNAGRSTHLNQDTGERRNANFLGDLFKPNTRRTSVEGGQYANGGNIDNLYQAGGNLTEYNGNTHESGGIPLGNTNNEVEDGEIRWDTPDGEAYIFSNRIPYTKSKKK